MHIYQPTTGEGNSSAEKSPDKPVKPIETIPLVEKLVIVDQELSNEDPGALRESPKRVCSPQSLTKPLSVSLTIQMSHLLQHLSLLFFGCGGFRNY